MNKIRRIGAILGLILLFSMYAITLVASIFATPYAHGLFLASTFSTIVVPIMIWLAITVYQWVHRDDPDTSAANKDDPDTNDTNVDDPEMNGTNMEDSDKNASASSEPPEAEA